MGRPKKELDLDILFDFASQGMIQRDQAKEFGISIPTLTKRIADIQSKHDILLQYRSLQSLQLTELQARVLEAITPDKIEEAGLKDLVLCYKILKDKELVVEGKPTEIKGLVAHLIHLEQMEMASVNVPLLPESFEDGEFEDLNEGDKIPELLA